MLRICKLLENIASSFQLKTVIEFTRPVEDGIENRCSGLFVKCRQFGNTDCSPHKSLSHLDSCHEYQCAHEWKKHTRDVHWLCYHSFESGHHTVGVNSRYSSVSSRNCLQESVRFFTSYLSHDDVVWSLPKRRL